MTYGPPPSNPPGPPPGGYGPPQGGSQPGGYGPPGQYGQQPPPQYGQQPPGQYGPPQGQYGAPQYGGAPSGSGFDFSKVNPLDWGIVGAGLLAFIFSFIDFYDGATVDCGSRGSGSFGDGQSASAWHDIFGGGFFAWFAMLFAVLGAVAVALEIFTPNVKFPYPNRLLGLGLFALAAVFEIIAIFVTPGDSGFGCDVSLDHGFGFWASLIVILAGLVLSLMRVQQSGTPLPGFLASVPAIGGGAGKTGGHQAGGVSYGPPSNYGQPPGGYPPPPPGYGAPQGQPPAPGGFGPPQQYTPAPPPSSPQPPPGGYQPPAAPPPQPGPQPGNQPGNQPGGYQPPQPGGYQPPQQQPGGYQPPQPGGYQPPPQPGGYEPPAGPPPRHEGGPS